MYTIHNIEIPLVKTYPKHENQHVLPHNTQESEITIKKESTGHHTSPCNEIHMDGKTAFLSLHSTIWKTLV